MSDWRDLAAGMLENERRMRPFHRPPSTGCIVSWRGGFRIGMIQHPVSAQFEAIVLLSITSKYLDPEYIRAVRNLDPGRLQLTVDDAIDLTGRLHVLHRDGERLTHMTPEETRHIAERADLLFVTEVNPTADGARFEPTAGPAASVLKLHRGNT